MGELHEKRACFLLWAVVLLLAAGVACLLLWLDSAGPLTGVSADEIKMVFIQADPYRTDVPYALITDRADIALLIRQAQSGKRVIGKASMGSNMRITVTKWDGSKIVDDFNSYFGLRLAACMLVDRSTGSGLLGNPFASIVEAGVERAVLTDIQTGRSVELSSGQCAVLGQKPIFLGNSNQRSKGEFRYQIRFELRGGMTVETAANDAQFSLGGNRYLWYNDTGMWVEGGSISYDEFRGFCEEALAELPASSS